MKNVWLLTEERPKTEVVENLLRMLMKDEGISGIFKNISFIPILDEGGKFAFKYEVLGLSSQKINKIYIKTISGDSSFVDYLLYYQEEEPKEHQIPNYVIEETKTDDQESRNTGVYQRASKFVYARKYYPDAKQIMYYSLKVTEGENLTQTNIFGTKCLKTIGVKIVGKKDRLDNLDAFTSIEELIEFKSSMRKPPKGNVPVDINIVSENKITISGRLIKGGSLAHDPNIGMLTLIGASLRELGWTGEIVITEHGLEQRHLSGRNKFVRIANLHSIKLDELQMPASKDIDYWHYESKGEKLGTIFIHLAVENFTSGQAIFENHAGSEKSYFVTSDGDYVALAKYKDRTKYKNGDKTQIVAIPDLILVDFDRSEVINIEGKKFENKAKGIDELENFDAIESTYIKPSYKDYQIVRTVVLYGGEDNTIKEVQVGFLLNKKGKMVLGPKAPNLFTDAIENLKDYWG